MQRSTAIAIVVLGLCVLVAAGMVWWARDVTAGRRAEARGDAARASVEASRALAPSAPVHPADDPCPPMMAPIEDDPAFGAAPGTDAHALVVAELEALLAEGRGPMRELRDRAHVRSLDAATMEAGRLLGCAQRRNGSRANRLAGYVSRLRRELGARGANVEHEVGIDAEGLSDAEYERLEADPRLRALDVEADWLIAAGTAADDAFRCVDGEPNEGAQPSCDRVAAAIEVLR